MSTPTINEWSNDQRDFGYLKATYGFKPEFAEIYAAAAAPGAPTLVRGNNIVTLIGGSSATDTYVKLPYAGKNPQDDNVQLEVKFFNADVGALIVQCQGNDQLRRDYIVPLSATTSMVNGQSFKFIAKIENPNTPTSRAIWFMI